MVEFGRGCTARGACIVQLTVAVPTMPPGTLNLLQLDDGVLANVVTQLAVADPLARRTLMLVCTRLRGLAQAAVHSYQRPGQSIMDAVDLAAPGDTLHLLPGYYKEALLLRKALHLTCDEGQARILSPARFAIMCNAGGCLLENLVLKSHQIDESVFFLVEYGPRCHFVQLRHCEVLQGSYIGIQDLKGPNSRMVLQHCLLHVGVSLMAGRLDMSDCTIKCTGDSLWAYPQTTLVLRRCQFCDIADAIFIECSTAVIEACHVWAYERGPFCVTDTTLAPDDVEEGHRTAVINNRLLYLEDQPPENVWISVPARIRATGTRASDEQRAAALRGELVPGHVVMWGNTVFESRSNEGISAQQEEVRREARQLMLQMQRAWDEHEGLDPEEVSIGNSVENPVPNEESEGDDPHEEDWDSEVDLDEDGLPADWGAGHAGDVIDLLSDTSSGSSGLDSGLSGFSSDSDSDSGSDPGSTTTSSSDDSQGPGGHPGDTSTSSSDEDEEGGGAPGAGDRVFSDDSDSTSSSDASGAP